MKGSKGLTLVEVIVAMLLLAILGVGLLGMLPMLTKNTVGASVGTEQGQKALSAFEQIQQSWSNTAAWGSEGVWNTDKTDLVELADFVAAAMGSDSGCSPTVTSPSSGLRLVVITCVDPDGDLPTRTYRAEFGNPDAG